MLPSLLLAAAAAALLRARLPTGAWPARTAARAPTPLASTHWVLGLNQYSHDAGACLLAADGSGRSAAQGADQRLLGACSGCRLGVEFDWVEANSGC